MTRAALTLFAAVLVLPGQNLTKPPMSSIHEETFHGRRAWVLQNGLMRVTVLAGGGHIAEVRLLSDDPQKNVNPMRVAALRDD